MSTTQRVSVAIGLALSVLIQVDVAAQRGGGGQGTAAAPAQKEELSESYRGSQRQNIEYQKVAPIKVFDNLYYVGPGFVSVWLLQTTDGLILIDTAQDPYEDHVLNGIRTMGFDPRNIKYIIISHGHLDHFGGAAKIQAASGARVVMLGIPGIPRVRSRPNSPSSTTAGRTRHSSSAGRARVGASQEPSSSWTAPIAWRRSRGLTWRWRTTAG